MQEHSTVFCILLNLSFHWPLQRQYVFIHDALSELVTCGQTEIAAGDLRIATNKLSKMVNGREVTGYQRQFEVSPPTQLHV